MTQNASPGDQMLDVVPHLESTLHHQGAESTLLGTVMMGSRLGSEPIHDAGRVNGGLGHCVRYPFSSVGSALPYRASKRSFSCIIGRPATTFDPLGLGKSGPESTEERRENGLLDPKNRIAGTASRCSNPVCVEVTHARRTRHASRLISRGVGGSRRAGPAP